jgi:hypothetical protein
MTPKDDHDASKKESNLRAFLGDADQCGSSPSGHPRSLSIRADPPTSPEKLIRAAGHTDGISWIALRYSNAVSAEHPVLADQGPTIIPGLTGWTATCRRR